jgi:iron complex outermembrane recepter protein
MRRSFLLFFLSLGLLSSTLYAQNLRLTGKVTNQADGTVIPGVTVMIKGTTSGTTTDVDGNYSLTVSSGATLVFSFMGMVSQEVVVQQAGVLNIALNPDSMMLEEFVVTAMGISRERKALGYAATTLSSMELTRVGSPNFATALYGKAPGVRVLATPGGATSAVNINIRGVNSITGKSQPLIVVDGVPIRDGEVNNNDFWGDQRIRGNGLVDLNPEDIEDLTILSGASAAALYGSEAVNGVVLITTKSGRGVKGFRVEAVSNYTRDYVAYLPQYQNKFGPGYPIFIGNAGQDADGWIYHNVNGQQVRGHINTNVNFGPAFDGKTQVMAWDGIVRPWEAQKDHYAALFEPATSLYNQVAISMGNDQGSARVAITRQDNTPVSLNSKNTRNILNLNSTYNLGRNYRMDVVLTYNNQETRNRPYMVDRLWNNFGGMMTRFDNAEWYMPKYKTSLGYRHVVGANTQSLTPEENILYGGSRPDIFDYLWQVKSNELTEMSDRLIGSLTNTWQITSDFSVRGRVSTDFTTMKTEQKNPNTIPLAFGNSGYFGMNSWQYKLLYTDILATYKKKVTTDLTMGLNAGYTARSEEAFATSRGTNGGLSTENRFDISASVNTANSGSSRSFFMTDALFGIANLDYKGMLFLESTIRRDRTSTMHPDNNAFYYPSVNASFVFSEAFEMPRWFEFGKFRGSYGVVGNYPDQYRANIAYNQGTLGTQSAGGQPVLYTNVPMRFGNDNIKPEERHEIEFGLETGYLGGRIGLDVTYYDGETRDQILELTTPASSGASSVLTNIGILRNQGVEVALKLIPVKTRDIHWNMVFNVASNKNTVVKLTDGANFLLHGNFDGDAAELRSEVGKPMGSWYSRPIEKDANGQPLVDERGLYRVSPNEWEYIGNAMDRVVGGFMNSFTYKNLTLDMVVDYRFGSHIMPTAIYWMISRGLLTDALDYRDKESGGVSYFIQNGVKVPFTGSGNAGPNGEIVYHDGVILSGVRRDNGQPNNIIASSSEMYLRTNGWGGPQYNPWAQYRNYISPNDYIKMREISLSYSIPKSLVEKYNLNNLTLSVYARNPFFLYRTQKHFDPEQIASGSRWTQQVTNLGNNPATRSFGGSVRFNF